MNRATRTASVLLLTGMMLSLATPALPTGSGLPEPGAFGIPINPNASGTKLSGPMTIAYEIQEVDIVTCLSGRLVNNMFVVVTLEQGNNIKPFNRDFTKVGQAPICFDNQAAQVNFVFALIHDQVIPFFFGCLPGQCPLFEVKSITDFLTSNTGALSLNITLAVH